MTTQAQHRWITVSASTESGHILRWCEECGCLAHETQLGILFRMPDAKGPHVEGTYCPVATKKTEDLLARSRSLREQDAALRESLRNR